MYDTTELPPEIGIHVHARNHAKGNKKIDCTYRAVRLMGQLLPEEGILVSELDAIYFLVSNMFGFQMRHVLCTHCGCPHLDTDWFSVHPHRRHLCAGCGLQFSDTQSGIGNPIIGVRNAIGGGKRETSPSNETLNIKQADYPHGIQIWGSNAAFLWTRRCPEIEGIHVHAYGKNPNKREVDETFGHVVIDGIELDATMVRVLMAQSALPHLKDRIRSMDCPWCGESQFSDGEQVFTPSDTHQCTQCRKEFLARGRYRKIILNPLPKILECLAKKAPRQPQKHSLDLLPETLQC